MGACCSCLNKTPRNRVVSDRPPHTVQPLIDGVHSGTVIFLHGLGDQGDNWANLFEAQMRLFHVKYIFPSATSLPICVMCCKRVPAWFNIYGRSLNSPEDVSGIESATRYVHRLIDEEVRAGIRPENIVIAGYSQGGALALYAGLTYRSRLAGICCINGFLVRRNKVLQSCTANLRTPILLTHGRADTTVPYKYAQRAHEKLAKTNPFTTLKTYNTGHEIDDAHLQDLKSFILRRLPRIHP